MTGGGPLAAVSQCRHSPLSVQHLRPLLPPDSALPPTTRHLTSTRHMGQDLSACCLSDQRDTIISTGVYFLASMRSVRGPRGRWCWCGGGGAVEWKCEAPRPSQHPRQCGRVQPSVSWLVTLGMFAPLSHFQTVGRHYERSLG